MPFSLQWCSHRVRRLRVLLLATLGSWRLVCRSGLKWVDAQTPKHEGPEIRRQKLNDIRLFVKEHKHNFFNKDTKAYCTVHWRLCPVYTIFSTHHDDESSGANHHSRRLGRQKCVKLGPDNVCHFPETGLAKTPNVYVAVCMPSFWRKGEASLSKSLKTSELVNVSPNIK